MKIYEHNPGEVECEEARCAISASLDNELAKHELARLSRHLKTCTKCNEYAIELQVLDNRLKGEEFDHAETTALWDRVKVSLDQEDDARRSVVAANDSVVPGDVIPLTAKVQPEQVDHGVPEDNRVVLSRRGFMAASIAAGIVSAVGAATVYYSQPARAYDVVSETVNDFLTFRASGQALHVTGNVPSEVKTWLATRVSFEIPFEPRAPEGFHLVGGRLCSFLNRRLAFFHYEKGAHAISLYVMSEAGLSMPDAGYQNIGKRRVAATSIKGVTNLIWNDESLIYVAVSDLGEADVFEFVKSI